MVAALLLSFAVIFVAELGDKSQLMALAFATRYPAGVVLAAITVSTAIVHALSVGLGAVLDAAIPERLLVGLAGVAFVGFGAWTLRGDQLSDDEQARAARPARSAFLTIGVVFLLAELGDKTMLATVTLAAGRPLVPVWLGSTLGMVAADALAIVVGRVLGARLPERVIRIGAALTFFGFGLLLSLQAVLDRT